MFFPQKKNCLKCLKIISENILATIKYKAESIGHSRAIREVLSLPEQSEEELKQWARNNYRDMATGSVDRYFTERCWVCAYGAILKIDFIFPHIDPYIYPPIDIPAKEPEE